MRRHQSKKPMRRCVGCRQSFPQDELLRYVLTDGILNRDDINGRGYYICDNPKCQEAALKRRIANAKKYKRSY
ncbi:MAG: YlxR family protein [Clostridiales bacterium]|nr:YlxR family protein [Candidatus Crickella caballi]